MRRILIGALLGSLAIGAAIVVSQPGPMPDAASPAITKVRDMRARQMLEEAMERALQFDALSRFPNISFMNCRIIAEEPLGGDRFMLTEECVWRSGRVERRRFHGILLEDGTSYGWMIRPRDDST